ncbi:MAG: hypothetical protein OMM_14880, partial [Candidatus Magnetoglobus multicellularis str. Araruama]
QLNITQGVALGYIISRFQRLNTDKYFIAGRNDDQDPNFINIHLFTNEFGKISAFLIIAIMLRFSHTLRLMASIQTCCVASLYLILRIKMKI